METISHKVSLMLPTEECWSLVGRETIMVVLPVDSMKWSKSKETNRYRNFFLGADKTKKLRYEKVTIPNTGFTLELFPSYEKPYYHYFVRSYTEVHLIKLKHPDLEKYPFIVATYIDARDLVNIIAGSGNVVDHVISGSFCCTHTSGTSGIWNTIFKVEDPENTKMSEEKNLGKMISEKRGTTKWKVGYEYITKNERSFIYLGEIREGWFKPNRSSGFGENFPTGFSCYAEKLGEKTYLILDTTSLPQDEKELVKCNKGGYISSFLEIYLSYHMANGKHAYYNHVKTIKKSTHPGIETECIFKDDGGDLKNLIINFYTSRYPDYKNYLYLVDRSKLGPDNLRTFDSNIISIIKSYVSERLRGSYYRSSSSTDFKLEIAKDPDKFLEYLKSHKPNYMYYGTDIYGVLNYLGDDEFKKLAAKCTF